MFYKYKKTTGIIYGIFMIMALIAIDQITKLLALAFLKDSSDIILIKGILQLHYLENNGAAFSMLSGKQTFFLVMTPIVLILIGYTFVKMPVEKKYQPLDYIIIFIIAGALGNYIDRFRNHYVIDFIYFSLINFPVFNVADIYVTCSVILLILLIIFYYKDKDFEELSNSIKPNLKFRKNN